MRESDLICIRGGVKAEERRGTEIMKGLKRWSKGGNLYGKMIVLMRC